MLNEGPVRWTLSSRLMHGKVEPTGSHRAPPQSKSLYWCMSIWLLLTLTFHIDNLEMAGVRNCLWIYSSKAFALCLWLFVYLGPLFESVTCTGSPYPDQSCQILPNPILSYPILSYPILSYPILFVKLLCEKLNTPFIWLTSCKSCCSCFLSSSLMYADDSPVLHCGVTLKNSTLPQGSFLLHCFTVTSEQIPCDNQSDELCTQLLSWQEQFWHSVPK